MGIYKALSKQTYTNDNFSLVPIRSEDRYHIMQWRNEQMYHLRQTEPLTKEKQDWYFENVVANLFDHEKPDQILFSFLQNEQCIGYGGLVHINWIDRNAEISFLMNTELESHYFATNWLVFLSQIEIVSFQELKLHKVYTYAFDIRKQLNHVLEKGGFKKEAVLKEHYLHQGRFVDVLIHSKFNRQLKLRKALDSDVDITYKWAVDPLVRRYALNQSEITYIQHKKWFAQKITDPKCDYLIADYNAKPVGSFRIDVRKDKDAVISYLLDPEFHGLGLGYLLLKEGVDFVRKEKSNTTLIGEVKDHNKASIRIFESFGFNLRSNENNLLVYELSV